MIRRLTRVNIALILLGLSIATIWVYLTGGPQNFRDLLRVDPMMLMVLLGITSFCVFVRFVRWQYLLRCVGVRVPARSNLSIFLASLAGTATPGYVGELVRCVFMRRRFRTPMRVSLTVLIYERLLDVWVLAVMAALTSRSTWVVAIMLAVAAVTVALGFAGAVLAENAGVQRHVVVQLGSRATLGRALVATSIAWASTAFLISVAARALGIEVAARASLAIFSAATLLGGLTLMPAGVGTTGSVAIFELQTLGVPLADAVVVVSLVRLATVGFAIAVSSVFLVLELRNLRRQATTEGVAHFDEIADQYGEQLPDHVWRALLERKMTRVTAALGDLDGDHLGLDLGCGLGRQCLDLRRRGYHVIGLDASHNLLQHARDAGVAVSAGSALALPFRDASFDFVLTVGVLHHLEGPIEQQAACREVARVLKPDGLFLVHETNPRNPLFRFYMGYVFPLLRSIDLGTEWWIAPRRWEDSADLHVVRTDYFTFLPDFLPARLTGPLGFLERRLESSRLRTLSVHYMATMKKPAAPHSSADGAGAR